jgi:hypothetical protein
VNVNGFCYFGVDKNVLKLVVVVVCFEKKIERKKKV